MQVTEHFSFAELCKRDHHILTPVQMEMVSRLCSDILEPIRTYLTEQAGKTISIKVVSGVRFPSDNNRLKKQGYNPSETSDHLFGNIIKLHNPVKIRKYGKYFQYSVGAVDIVPACGAKEAWDLMYPYFNKKEGRVFLPNRPSFAIGQMILEKRKTYWIHISNPKQLIYNDFITQTFLKREPFLISQDNGVTYKPI